MLGCGVVTLEYSGCMARVGAMLVALAAGVGCSGGKVGDSTDATSEAAFADDAGKVDAVPGGGACPEERPIAGTACPLEGWVCLRTCTVTDRRAWTAECRRSAGRLEWSAWGNPCSTAPSARKPEDMLVVGVDGEHGILRERAAAWALHRREGPEQP